MIKSVGAYTTHCFSFIHRADIHPHAQQCAGQIFFYIFASSSAAFNAYTLNESTTRWTSRRQVRHLIFPPGRHLFSFPNEFFRAWYLRCFKKSLVSHITILINCSNDVLTWGVLCWRDAFHSPPFCDKQSLPGLVHTVIRMTNLSMIGMMSSMCAAVGVWASLHSVGVTSLNLFQTGHAPRFSSSCKT